MRWKGALLTLSLSLGLFLVLTGCQGAPAAAPASGSKAATVDILMNEWSMKPSVSAILAGPVTLEAINQGKEEHEMVLLKTDRAPTALPLQAGGDKVDEEASGTSAGEIEEISAGATKAATFNLTPGHYVLVCNEPGHYKNGMAASFEVR